MRLSEFKDEKAIEVVAKLMLPITEIAKNTKNKESRYKNRLEFASALLQNNAKEIKEILAILNDTSLEEYHCTAASVLNDVLEMVTDPEMMALFGLRSKTPPSSGSASENTEGQKA